jgi:hypothetical protein
MSTSREELREQLSKIFTSKKGKEEAQGRRQEKMQLVLLIEELPFQVDCTDSRQS